MDLLDPGLLDVFQETGVVGANLFDAMTVVRQDEPTPHAHKHLCDGQARVWLRQALAQTSRVELQQPAVRGDIIQVALHLLPYTVHAFERSIFMVAQQAYEVEVTHDRRLESLEHAILLIKIVFEKPLVCATCLLSSLFVHCAVEVDRYCVGVVDGSHEEVESVLVEDTFDDIER